MKLLPVIVSGLLLATAATAQSNERAAGEEASNQAAAAKGSNDQESGAERQVCRRINTATGSRMSLKKICMTAAEWRRQERQGL